MRIQEIITEHEFPKIKNRSVRNKIPDLYDYNDLLAYNRSSDQDIKDKSLKFSNDPKVSKLGIGAFTTVYKHQDTPHDVTKGSKAMHIPDGFYAFFHALSVDKKAQINPYFPRFRNINIFRSADAGRSSYVVKIEYLEKFNSLSKKEKYMLFHKLFNKEGRHLINNDDKSFMSGIMSVFDNADVNIQLRSYIKDKYFLEAVNFILDISREKDYLTDIHPGNIMIRRTSIGPQIVINDPLSFREDDLA